MKIFYFNKKKYKLGFDGSSLAELVSQKWTQNHIEELETEIIFARKTGGHPSSVMGQLFVVK